MLPWSRWTNSSTLKENINHGRKRRLNNRLDITKGRKVKQRKAKKFALKYSYRPTFMEWDQYLIGPGVGNLVILTKAILKKSEFNRLVSVFFFNFQKTRGFIRTRKSFLHPAGFVPIIFYLGIKDQTAAFVFIFLRIMGLIFIKFA